ncbi:D-alanyl-D-alanine carboxypeptidase / Penicillin binding protein PBP4 [Staphylococcus aureus]|nr:D-alanyl-D-alanine carboxypeptidase / Penicillin binding protein PBP4 [Staphylococcus aureus]
MKNLISIIIILCLTLSIMTPYAQATNSDVTPVQAANQYGYAGLSAAHTNRRVLLM